MINVTKEMEHLHKLAKRDSCKRFNHLWENIISVEWLAQAWEQIRNNKGSQTAGIDNKTAVDVDLDLIHKLAEELRTGKYRPKPVRRVHIPKANGKLRPLGISTIKDRLVQQALKMLLEPIFEADFYNCSHGFRQGLSTHTALRDVAHAYPSTSWIIEGDIESCYDSIPRGKLMEQIGKRIADEKVLRLIKLFLKAGYIEDWKYNQTYSGVPQGNIVGPLLSNIFLHQLDEFVIKELAANRAQKPREALARRNPEYHRVTGKITYYRRKLAKQKWTGGADGRQIIKQIKRLERQRKHIPRYTKDKRHPCKIKYVRYADDTLFLIVGNKQETEAIKARVKEKLSTMGLNLSEEKTKITHWSHPIEFLGYRIHGKMRDRGVGIRAVLSIPREKVRKIQEGITQISNHYHIPQVDVMAQINAIYKGWCNYYRYANSPQKVFSKLSSYVWWSYAHFLARKQKSSIAAMIQREMRAKRLVTVQRNGRKRKTFQIKLEKKTLTLDLFAPRTQAIKAIGNKQNWEVDLRPVTPMNWQSGRSLATRLEALDRAQGICEQCNKNPVDHIHHTVPIKRKSFIARVMSDKDQRYTAKALCRECHLEVHGGSFNPRKQRSGGSAQYIERCSLSAGSAG
jgi:group II intron reverse transcriptase/maturase